MRRALCKRLLVLTMVSMAVLLVACAEDDEPSGPARARTNFEDDGAKVYFSFRDPTYDDRGPGSYTYPLLVEQSVQRRLVTGSSDTLEDRSTRGYNLDGKTGLFDITKFEVIDGGPNVVFEISTARPIPKTREDLSTEAKGWFLQLMDIYIDKDRKPGSGRTRTLPGRAVSFAPDCGWEQMILVTPQVSFDVRRLIEQITWDLDFVRMKNDIVVAEQVFVEGYTFRVFVPKGQIGEPQPTWGYQCMMMMFNPSNLEYGHFQQGKVKRFPGTNQFGGADEYNGHPNVIDVLAPTPEDQYAWLSDFISSPSSGENRYAFVPLIYAEDVKKARSRSPTRQAQKRRDPGLQRESAPEALEAPGERVAAARAEPTRERPSTPARGRRGTPIVTARFPFVPAARAPLSRSERVATEWGSGPAPDETDAAPARAPVQRRRSPPRQVRPPLDEEPPVFSNTGAEAPRTGYRIDRFDAGDGD
ncbi:MAG: hypothetical protein HY815_04505 [Candidatus Riflebacteria bacterium]|nr:hypothetical protein [Candidatus Riflebacteria bacterium]